MSQEQSRTESPVNQKDTFNIERAYGALSELEMLAFTARELYEQANFGGWPRSVDWRNERLLPLLDTLAFRLREIPEFLRGAIEIIVNEESHERGASDLTPEEEESLAERKRDREHRKRAFEVMEMAVIDKDFGRALADAVVSNPDELKKAVATIGQIDEPEGSRQGEATGQEV
jgi:hypothetical protein